MGYRRSRTSSALTVSLTSPLSKESSYRFQTTRYIRSPAHQRPALSHRPNATCTSLTAISRLYRQRHSTKPIRGIARAPAKGKRSLSHILLQQLQPRKRRRLHNRAMSTQTALSVWHANVCHVVCVCGMTGHSLCGCAAEVGG